MCVHCFEEDKHEIPSQQKPGQSNEPSARNDACGHVQLRDHGCALHERVLKDIRQVPRWKASDETTMIWSKSIAPGMSVQ